MVSLASTAAVLFGLSLGAATLLASPDVCDCRLEGYWEEDEWWDVECATVQCDAWCGLLFDAARGHWYCECLLMEDKCMCRTAVTYTSSGAPDYQCEGSCNSAIQTCKKPTPLTVGSHVICNCRN